NPYNQKSAYAVLALRGTFDIPQKLARIRQAEADVRDALAQQRGADHLVRLEIRQALGDLDEARQRVLRYTNQSTLGKHLAVQAGNGRVRAALDRYFKAPLGPAKEKARAEAREAVGALLDFQALAQATMGKHWAELKADQRVRYTNALRGAMEANYLSKMQQGQVDMSKVRNEILGEEKQGDKTLVKTRVV